ncbi:MAG TPA: proton-conducting transporter membrane subunit [bacterium]|nr:proton-conducting transporter membrane subunit [bacterium]
MTTLEFVVAAAVLLCVSGVPALMLPARSLLGQRTTTVLVLTGSIMGLLGSVPALVGASAAGGLRLPWFLPQGQGAIGIDALSAFFLVLIFVVPALGSIYGLEYWKQGEHSGNGRKLGLFYGILAGSMALVVVARNGFLFMIVWEVMAMAAFFAATAEDDNPEVRNAGWVYLIATHVGTLCLLAMFALWKSASGSFQFELAPAMPQAVAGIIFVLALVGFGFKAGIMPLHVWLPGAHANAPSHVSAVMSGVMLKMGVYGIIRMTALLPLPSTWWGSTTLIVGAVTGLAGIAFAISQNDIKRMLAYSSIENIGIIMMGIGLALLGRAMGRVDWMLLGMGGALLHVWNHGLFKSLLFLNAGAIIHAQGTREIDRMGGLARSLPLLAALFAVGAVAISALPPLNGFVSEWLIYLGLFGTLGLDGGPGFPVAATAAVFLAMIGSLAVATFVKLLGTVFLGSPRRSGPDAEHRGHALSVMMTGPMIALAITCLAIGLVPALFIPAVERAAYGWMPATASGQALLVLAPVRWLGLAGVGLVALIAMMVLVSRIMLRGKNVRRGPTWDCGYARPSARMQYTGSSLGQSIVGLFSVLLRPRTAPPLISGAMPTATAFESQVPDTVLDKAVVPVFSFLGLQLPRIRFMQQGKLNLYLLYIVVITALLFIFGSMGVRP